MQLPSALQQLVQQEAGALVPSLAVDLVEGIQPLLRLGGVDVGQLVLELVEVHRSRDFSGILVGRGKAMAEDDLELQVSGSEARASRWRSLRAEA